VGDRVNVLLGAAAFNFKRMLNKYKEAFWGLLGRLLFPVRVNFWVMRNTPETSVVRSPFLFNFKISPASELTLPS